MSRYKRYEKYKDSGVEWIGEIPEHWELNKLKRLSNIITGNTPSKSEEENYDDEGIPWVKPDNIQDDGTVSETKERLSVIGLQKARLIPKNSAIVCCIGTVGKVGFTQQDCTTNQQINSIIFDRISIWNSKYGFYCLYSSKNEHEKYSNKVVVSILNKTQQGNIIMPVPSLDEQKAIVNFLDQKTAEIDGLIADKEKLIELLQEKRQAIITEAVTKGLNPNVKMKDSGIEWIGEIPEHWEIGRLKNSIKSCRNGIWGDEPQGDNNDIACIRVTNFNRTNMEIEVNDLTIRNIPASKQKLYLLKYGDLLIEKSGGGEKQPVGFVTIFKHNIPAVYANFIARIELDKRKAYSGFFKYIYSAMYSIRLNVRSIKQTTGIQNLDTNYYFDERVMYPPLNEQIHIANFLDQKTAEIDDLITEIKLQIQKLKEYRQSLIFEAVTGKIDVRDYVVD